MDTEENVEGNTLVPVPKDLFEAMLATTFFAREMIGFAFARHAVNDWQIIGQAVELGLLLRSIATEEDVAAGVAAEVGNEVLRSSPGFDVALRSFSQTGDEAVPEEEAA